MRIGDQLRALEAAGADDHAYRDHPNVMQGERVEGRVVNRGGAPHFQAPDGRLMPLARKQAGSPDWRGPAVATVVEQIGAMPRAYDVVESRKAKKSDSGPVHHV